MSADEAQEAVALFRKPLGADAAHAGARACPTRCAARRRPAAGRDQEARPEGIDLLLQLPRDVLETDQLHPAAAILQRVDHLQEVAVAGDQDDLLEFLGLEHGVHRHVEIGVRLGGDVAGLIGVAAHVLDGDLPAEVPHHLLVGAGLLVVLDVFARALRVEGDIGIQTLQDAVLACGEALRSTS
jgi:hypothetical protein